MRHHSIALLGIWTLESRVCSIWQCKKCACCLFCCYVYYSVPKTHWPGQKPCWVTGLHNSTFWVSCMGPQYSQLRHLHIKRPMGPGSIHFGLSLSQEHLRKPKSYNSCPSNDYHRSRPLAYYCSSCWEGTGCRAFPWQVQWNPVLYRWSVLAQGRIENEISHWKFHSGQSKHCKVQ